MGKINPQFFRIKNWDSFQHYRDRNPKWVKLHFETLFSRDWLTLDDHGRALMIVCMLVGSRHNGQVPNDANYLARIGHLNGTPCLNSLVTCGFLEPPKRWRNKGNVATKPLQNVRPEKESELEIEKEQNLVGSAAPNTTRNVYDLLFEQFWKGYPTDRLMSKKLAATRWSRLSLEDRKTVIDSLPAFRAYCSSKPDYRPVHAERYLSQRRFDGFGAAPAQEASASVALAEENTKKLEAMWEAQRVSGTGTQP